MTESKLRAGLIASVKIAQKDLGLDDTTYRSLLQGVTGMDSAARCTVPQLKAMLAELRAKGWTPRPRNVPQELRPLHAKITAIRSLEDDGRLGDLLRAQAAERLYYYKTRPGWPVYGRGWQARTQRCFDTCRAMLGGE